MALTIAESLMGKSIRLTFVVLVGLFFTACAWVHQTAHLKLNPQIASADIGNGTPVRLRVVDQRLSPILGRRGLDSQDAPITTDQNVADLFHDKIDEGLTRKGFRTVPDTDSTAQLLVVEIRQIEYTTDLDYWIGLIQAQATLHASSAKNGLKFDQVYQGQKSIKTVEAPTAKTNEQLLNAAISEAVERLFADEKLVRFLAR
jgi:uncharacterized lipoprotein YajG